MSRATRRLAKAELRDRRNEAIRTAPRWLVIFTIVTAVVLFCVCFGSILFGGK